MATDWHRYNLPAIWQMVQPENVCTAADRVLAWEALATAVREQHRRLLRAGEALADVWPPEHNKSALKFLNRIDDLAASMLETLTCAEDTRTGLRGVTETLAEAQSTIRDLATGRAAVSTDWVPRFIDHAEDDYDKQAQQTMQAAEATIAEHTQNLKTPPLYAPGARRQESRIPFSNEDIVAEPVVVQIPREPIFPELGAGAGSGVDAGSNANRPTPDPSPGIGPGLSGVTAQPPAPAPAPGPGFAPSLPATPGAVGGVPPGLPVGTGQFGFVPGGGGVGRPARPGAPTGQPTRPIRPALPSGAVIGERGAGLGLVGQPPIGTMGNGRGRDTSGAGSSVGDADEQWEALEGVAPVINPDNRPVRHDPGPGVIGIDR